MQRDYQFSAWSPRATKSLVPDGDFKVRCLSKEWKQSDGKNPYLKLGLSIVDPDYAGLTLVHQVTDGVDPKTNQPFGFIPDLLCSIFSARYSMATPEQIVAMVQGLGGKWDDSWVDGAEFYVRTKRGRDEYDDRSDVATCLQRTVYELGCVGEGAARHGRRDMRSLETKQEGGPAGGGFNPAGRGTPRGIGGPQLPTPGTTSLPPPGMTPPGFTPPVQQPPQQQGYQQPPMPQYVQQPVQQPPYQPPVQQMPMQPQYVQQPVQQPPYQPLPMGGFAPAAHPTAAQPGAMPQFNLPGMPPGGAPRAAPPPGAPQVSAPDLDSILAQHGIATS